MKLSKHALFWRVFAGAHAWRGAMAVLALFLAGILEGMGVAVLLPVVASLTGAVGMGMEGNILSGAVESLFGAAGVPFTLGWLLLVMTLFIVGKAAISIAAMREVGKTAALVTAEFRLKLIRALLGARWKSYVSLALGRASTALGPEAERVSQYYLITCTTLADLFQVVVYFALALFLSWQLSLLALVAGVVVMFGLRGLVRMTRRAGMQQTLSLNDLLKRLSDALGSVKAIKAMGREEHYAELLKRDVELLQNSHRSGYYSKEFLRLSREPIVAVFMAAGLYVAATFYEADFAALMILALVFMRMAMKFMTIQSNYQRMVEQESAFQSMDSLIRDMEEKGEAFPGAARPALERGLELSHVHFKHAEYHHASVLENFSAAFPAKRLSMIVGPSGSGKTTILDLMIGFYAPDAGAILIDGRDLKEIDMRLWRRAISYVPQDSGLFHDTLWNNITLGDEGIGEAKVWAALEKAGAAGFVRDLPDGLQENLGERGQRLSGGQRQRIAIARALVRDPLLLLLDEPTSALDHQNEEALMAVLKDLSKDITVIMITHNMHLKSHADAVVSMK